MRSDILGPQIRDLERRFWIGVVLEVRFMITIGFLAHILTD